MRPRPDAIRPRSRPRSERVRPRPKDLALRPHWLRGLNIPVKQQIHVMQPYTTQLLYNDKS